MRRCSHRISETLNAYDIADRHLPASSLLLVGSKFCGPRRSLPTEVIMVQGCAKVCVLHQE